MKRRRLGWIAKSLLALAGAGALVLVVPPRLRRRISNALQSLSRPPVGDASPFLHPDVQHAMDQAEKALAEGRFSEVRDLIAPVLPLDPERRSISLLITCAEDEARSHQLAEIEPLVARGEYGAATAALAKTPHPGIYSARKWEQLLGQMIDALLAKREFGEAAATLVKVQQWDATIPMSLQSQERMASALTAERDRVRSSGDAAAIERLWKEADRVRSFHPDSSRLSLIVTEITTELRNPAPAE